MTYDPTIPNSESSPKSSVSAIQTNYSQFSSIFSSTSGGVIYNHMPLNNFNQGKHAAVLMQNQSNSISGFKTLAILYSANANAATGGPQPQLFLQIPQFLPTKLDPTIVRNNQMQLTYNSVNTSGPIYQSFLVGGYILYFGSTTTIGTAIVLSPVPTMILCAQAVSQGVITGNTPYTSAVTITQPKTIQISSSTAPGGAKFLWMAIAKA